MRGDPSLARRNGPAGFGERPPSPPVDYEGQAAAAQAAFREDFARMSLSNDPYRHPQQRPRMPF